MHAYIFHTGLEIYHLQLLSFSISNHNDGSNKDCLVVIKLKIIQIYQTIVKLCNFLAWLPHSSKITAKLQFGLSIC